ncbi:aminotransferase class V-fold PLP-dependent enzyme [Candidatus Saccharibacteria bacterium]|nr:aminotransferase class V-fold PLP-dependent enzyme [Candidatus Saccharibacteria bacterium]
MNKADFPSLVNNPDLVYLDAAATTPICAPALLAMDNYYLNNGSNIHRGLYPLAEEATEQYEAARRTVAEFIVGKKDELVFTRGTTESLNTIAYGLAQSYPEHEVFIDPTAHHANILPWRKEVDQQKRKISLLPLDGKLQIDWKKFSVQISDKKIILAITHISNVTGQISDIKTITELVRENCENAIIVVDGAQAVAHLSVDIANLDVDAYAFSAHKMYGPKGVGALWARSEILGKIPPFIVGGGSVLTVTDDNVEFLQPPEKFEAGTPPIAEAIGMAAACRFVQEGQFEDNELAGYLFQEISRLPVKVIGSPSNRSALVSFSHDKIHAHDLAGFLGENNVASRAGHHCTMPLHERLKIPASLRLSCGGYTNKEDIDRAVDILKQAIDQLS